MTPEIKGNPRLLSSRAKLLIVGAGVVVVVLLLTRHPAAPAKPVALPAADPFPTRLSPGELTETEANRQAATLPGGYQRPSIRPPPVRSPAEDPAKTAENKPPAIGMPASVRRDAQRSLPEIFRMPAEAPHPAPAKAATPPGSPAPAHPFAPFGRLIRCVLVNTLDSVTARAEPIVGLVTEDLSWNGEVIVPVNTEVFGYAQPAPIVDAFGVGRLVDTGEWTLVLPGRGRENGRELILKARAVDRRERVIRPDGSAVSWSMDDGADGLIGYTLTTTDSEEIKLFAAAAVGGLAQGFSQTFQTQQAATGLAGALGATQPAPTLANALTAAGGDGALAVMNQLASRIGQEITRRGVYVRVPASKEFYLFVEQSIDPQKAGIGLHLPAAPLFKP